MFITKRHIPRRTLLQRRRCCAGPAAARSDGSGPHAAGPDRRRAGQEPRSWGSSSRTGWRRDIGCRRPRALSRELPYILESLKNVKDQTVVMSGLWSKSAEPPEGTTGSDHWVAAAFLTANQAPQDRRFGRHRLQPDHRSADRAEDRPGQPAAVAAARRGRSEFELEQLRRRLQLLVHELDLVGGTAAARKSGRHDSADEPAADGAQPAGGLRAPVRQRRRRRSCAPRACSQSRSILDSVARGTGSLKSPLGAGIAGPSISTPTRSARSSAGCSLRRRHPPAVPEMALPSGHSGAVRRAHQAALRPDGAGVPGRHHARGDDARRAAI